MIEVVLVMSEETFAAARDTLDRVVGEYDIDTRVTRKEAT